MNRKNTHLETKQADAGRAGLRDLLRSPVVRTVMVVTAVGQVMAVQGKRPVSAGPEVVAKLEPLVVTDTRPVPAAREVAEGGEAADIEAFTARYRARGFKLSESLAEDIAAAAEENDIDPDVAFGLVHAESGFRNVATSRVGAVGLTQLMPATARWLEPGTTRSELRDPETNLRIGFKYLRSLIERYDGDVDLALTAYNRGPGTVDRALKRGRNPDNGYAAFVKTGKRGKHKG